MTIKVRYFASLKESLGRQEDNLNFSEPIELLQLWSACVPEMPLPDNILAAVNMEYTGLHALARDGDEVAFFPQVTGG